VPLRSFPILTFHMLIATLHALLNMCSFRTDAMSFHTLRKTILYLFRPQHFYGYHFAIIVGNLKPVSLSEVAPDNIILMQSYISPLNAELDPICHLLALLGVHHILHVSRVRVKISQLFNKLLEHIQSHPTPHPTHTHTRARTDTHTHARARTRKVWPKVRK